MKRRLLNFLFSLFVLAAALCVPQAAWADDLIVNDGTTTNEKVPVYGYYADTSGESQFVIPSGDLSNIAGGTISALKFYASSNFSFTGVWDVKLLETATDAVSSSFLDISSATLVYSGTLTVASNECLIQFSEDFTYTGGNLLVDIKLKTTGNCSSNGALLWYGVSTGTSRGGSGSYPSSQNFLPKVTVTYTPGGSVTCVRPASIDTANVTSTTADLVWTAGGTETAYQLIVTPKNGTPSLSIESDTVKSLTGLQPNTDYRVGVRAICGEGDTSRVTYASFRTACGTLSAFPWKEDFNEWNTGNVNESCWLNEHLDGSSTSLFQVSSTSQGGNTTNKLYLPYMTTGNITKLTLPEMNIPAANDYEFIIEMYRASSTSYHEEGLFVLAGNDTLGFIPRIAESDKGLNVATTSTDVPVENASGWYKYKFTIPNAGVQNIALVGRSKSGSATYADNLCVRKIPACKQVTNIQMTEVTKTSAKFAWTPNSGETSWNVEYIITDWEDYDTIATVVSGTPELELTGLTKATSYGFAIAVQADCGAEQAEDIATAEFYFNTDCDIITVENEGDTIHFGFEDFESGAVDRPCYYNDGTSNYWGRTTTSNSGGYALYAYGKSKHFVLGIPQVEIPENYELQFFVRNSSTYADTLEVYYNTVQSLEGATHLFSTGALNNTYTNYRVPAPRGEYYILFETHAGNSSSYFYLDDIYFTPIPQCAAIKDITLGEVTATTATFSWTPGGEESLWNVNYNDGADMSGSEEWDETSFTFEDLEPATAYSITVSVQAVCDGNVPAAEVPSMVLNFTTKCNAFDGLPWNETFNNISSGIPSCWNNDEGTTTTASYKWTYYSSGNTGACMRFNSYSNSRNNTNVLATPTIVLPEEPAELVFWCKNPSGGEFSVLLSADGGERVTLLSGLTGISTWTEKKCNLSAYAGKNVQIFFCGTSNYGTGEAYLDLDDVTVKLLPACQTPDNLKVDFDSHNATFSWNGNAAEYEVLLKKGNDTIVFDTIDVKSLTIDTLRANTAYSYSLAVRGICGEDSSPEVASQSFSFRTNCEPLTSLPWRENFENMTSGNINAGCWENEHVLGSSTYKFQVSTSAQGGNSTHMLCLPDMSDGNVCKLTLPVMNIPEDSAYEFNISVYRNSSYDTKVDEGLLVLAGEDTLAFIPRVISSTKGLNVATTSTDVPVETAEGWYSYGLVIPHAGVQSIVIYGISKYGTATYADNLSVRLIPSCLGATSLAVVDSVATTSSVTFSWKSDAPNFKVHYVSSDSTINQWVNTSLASLAISGLQHGKNYTFHLDVVAACSATDFAVDTLSGTLIATTKCAAISELPFRENFEESKTGSGNLPPCWEYTSTTATYPYVYNTTSSYAGDNCLYFYDGSPSTVREVVLPEITADLSNARIRFYYKSSVNSSYTYGKLMLGAMTDPADASTFVGLDTLDQQSAYTLYEKNLNVGEAKYLVLRYAGGTSSSGAAYVDNLIIDEIPTCFPASNLHGIDSLATASSVSFGWTPNADETSWQVILKQGNTVLADSVVADTVFTLGGLNHSSVYSFAVEVYVICGDVKAEVLEGNLSLKTLCNPEPIAQFPWTESFENMPAGEIDMPCWENEHKAGEGTKLFTVATSATGGNSTNKLQLPDMKDGTVTLLTLPAMNIPEDSAYSFGLSVYRSTSSKPTEGVRVFAHYAAPDTLVELAFVSRDYTVASGAVTAETAIGWYSYELPLPFAGVCNIVLQGESRYGTATFMDNLVVRKMPTCHKPKNLALSDVTTHSAQLTWEGNASDYEVLITVANDTVAIDTVNTAALAVDTLRANTAYAFTVTVRGLCGGEDGESEEVSKLFSFRTDCEAVSTLPWTENFENMTSGNINAGCWENEHVLGSSTYKFQVYTSAQGGNSTHMLYLPDMNDGNVCKLTLPVMNIPEDSAYEFNISVYRNSSYDTKVDEGLLVLAGEDTLAFIPRVISSTKGLNVATTSTDVPVETAAGWYSYSLVIPHAGVQSIVIYGISKYGTATYADNLSVRLIPSCQKPQGLDVVYDAHNATFSWIGNADNYEVVLKQGSATLLLDTINVTTLVIDTLQANTAYSYTLSVRGICGVEDGDSEANSASFSFTTLCNLIAADELPFTEDFDGNAVAYGYGAELPDCWTRTLDGSYPYVYATSSYAHSGSRCLYFYGGGATSESYAVLPGIASDLNGLRIRFYYYNGTAADAHGYLYVGVMSDPNDTATFVPLRKLDKLTDYADEPAEVALVAAPEGYHYIAFRHAGGTSNYGAAYVDDITVDALPNCRKPSDLDKVVGENEVTFTWVSNGDETEWKVVAIDMLHPEADTIRQTVSTMAFTINSLTGNTKYSYSISVKASCGDNEESEALVQAFSFRTLLPASFTEHLSDGVPFVADFASEEERSKWVMVGDEEPNHFIFGNDTIGIVTGATAGLYVSNNDSLNYYTTNTSSATASVRQFQVSDTSMLFYHFQWKAYGESTADYGRAFIAPESAAIEVVSHALKINGTQVAPSSSYTSAVPDDAEDLGGGKLNLASAWTTVNDSVALAPGTYKLIFVWGNDFSVGTQYPMAVGDVVLTAINIEHSSSTDLDGLKGDEDFDKAVKFIRNGHVFILHRGVIYDSTGRRVSIR